MISIFRPEKVIDANKVFSKPTNCYSKSGSLIAENKECDRVHFNIFKNETTRYDIKCYKNKQINVETIPFRTSTKKLYLNLNECSDRLHLSKDKLKRCNKNKDFLVLWNKKLNKIKLLEKINDHYHNILKHYDESDKNLLISKRTMDFPKILKSTLMKIVRIFHDQLQFNKLPAVFALDLTFKQIRKYSLENMYDIMASASENGRYFLINETKKDKIAFGTFGVVYKVDNISMGNIAAIKESRTDYNPDNNNFEFMIYDAYHDVKTEFSNLHMLYNIKLIANIQPPPYFSYKTESNYKQFCHVGYYFNIGDLYEASNMISFNLRLESFSHGFTALIYALYELHKQDLFHNDIKPENIFTKIDSNDVYQLCFGDMGSIRQATDMNEEFQIHEHTPIFTPFNPKALTFDCKQLKSVDVYQLGASFYNILTGNPPYLKDAETDDYPDFSLEFYTDILLETCSPEAILLLQRMCDPNQSSRYTIIDCVNHIEKSDFKWEKGK